jgi:hypothetical protein
MSTRVDLFLRPVTDEHVVYLYDPTVADAVVVTEERGGGGGGVAYREGMRRLQRERIAREDEEIMAVIAAFIQTVAA